jgi:hypothetical protein
VSANCLARADDAPFGSCIEFGASPAKANVFSKPNVRQWVRCTTAHLLTYPRFREAPPQSKFPTIEELPLDVRRWS